MSGLVIIRVSTFKCDYKGKKSQIHNVVHIFLDPINPPAFFCFIVLIIYLNVTQFNTEIQFWMEWAVTVQLPGDFPSSLEITFLFIQFIKV